MENNFNGLDLPLGFGMALAQNVDAMNNFAALPKRAQEQIIGHTHSITSKEEMQSYVRTLARGNAYPI